MANIFEQLRLPTNLPLDNKTVVVDRNNTTSGFTNGIANGVPVGQRYTGLVVYDTTAEGLYVWNGSVWAEVSGGGGGGTGDLRGTIREYDAAGGFTLTNGTFWYSQHHPQGRGVWQWAGGNLDITATNSTDYIPGLGATDPAVSAIDTQRSNWRIAGLIERDDLPDLTDVVLAAQFNNFNPVYIRGVENARLDGSEGIYTRSGNIWVRTASNHTSDTTLRNRMLLTQGFLLTEGTTTGTRTEYSGSLVGEEPQAYFFDSSDNTWYDAITGGNALIAFPS